MSTYQKQTRKQRRALRRIGETVYVSTRVGKDASNKLIEKLLKLNAGQLVKLCKRSIRRANEARCLLDDIHADSVFRPALEHDYKCRMTYFLAAKSELEYRALPLKEKLSRIKNPSVLETY